MTRLMTLVGVLALVFGIGFTAHAQQRPGQRGGGAAGQNPPTQGRGGNDTRANIEQLRAEIKRLQDEIKREESALKLARKQGDREGARHHEDQIKTLRERIKTLNDRIKDLQRGRGRL